MHLIGTEPMSAIERKPLGPQLLKSSRPEYSGPRLETLGKMAPGIAHDFNNALAIIVAWAQVGCQESPEDSAAHARFQRISEQAQRAAVLTRRLLTLAQGQTQTLDGF